MIAIENTKECYVQLWLRLEHTRQLLEQQGRRFCVRSLIRSWWPELTVKGELYIIGGKPFDDFVWEVCHMAEIEGYQHLQPPSLYPRKHREILRTIVAICLHTGVRCINLKALDAAYSEVFPGSTAIDTCKKSKLI